MAQEIPRSDCSFQYILKTEPLIDSLPLGCEAPDCITLADDAKVTSSGALWACSSKLKRAESPAVAPAIRRGWYAELLKLAYSVKRRSSFNSYAIFGISLVNGVFVAGAHAYCGSQTLISSWLQL